jgi:hypothetical protein
MAATLYPGIKSLHLLLDTPYDTIRTDDIRDDIVGVRVWISTSSGFDPQSGGGTLVFDGLSLSVTISNLEVNTVYYVKYAFISAIEPEVFTVSDELTATVYDETTSIYGYLTNDPTQIQTDSNGVGGNYSLTAGVFKVYELSQDVTGAGPVYGIVPGTLYGGLEATIDATTGAYVATALSSTAGSATLYAQYNGVTIEQVWNVSKALAGVSGTDAPILSISATGNSFIYKDESATTSSNSSITIKSLLTHISGTPTYTALAYTRAGVLLGNIEFTASGNDISITSEQFNPVSFNNTVGYVTVTASLGTTSDSFTIYRINDGSEQITVELSNQAHTIAAYDDGSVPEANYANSGTVVRVKQGNTYLAVDDFSPFALGTWRLNNITSTGITADPTPTIGSDYVNFDTHSSMTADVAAIDYEITGTSTTGKPFNVIATQSFSKARAGVKGSSAPVVVLTATSQAFVVIKNTGVVSPDTITLTATPSNLPNPVYSWKVDDVLQSGEVNSTLVINSFTGNPKSIQVDVSSGSGSTQVTAFDKFTVYSLKEGDDSVQAGLDNENQTISCDATGTPIAGQLPIVAKFQVVRGSTILSTGVSYSKVIETGMTSTINANGFITVSEIIDDFASATYRATVGSVVIDKILNLNKSKNGAAGTVGTAGPTLDISGTGALYRNSGGIVSPATSTLSALLANVDTPSYTWNIVNATPTNASGPSVTVTPDTGVNEVNITLTVTGANLSSQLSITRTIAIIDQGTAGQAGQNGIMSAYPTIYKWASSTPSQPTTTSTYTWATGSYTAPTGWSITAPSNSSPGYKLYTITVPLTVEATTVTSSLDWADSTNYPIRATTANGSDGSDGSNGAATFLIDRGADTSSTQPTANEVLVALGYKRYAVTGDIATIRYNSGNNSTAYRATSDGYYASWALQSTYITGSLIVQNSISGDRIIANSLSADRITNGTTSQLSSTSGKFSLGDQTFLVFPTTASFTANGAEKWAISGYNEGTSGFAHGIGAGHQSPGGFGVAGYAAYNITYTNMRTFGGLGLSNSALYGVNLRPSSYGTSNNLAANNTQFYGADVSYGSIIYSYYSGSNTNLRYEVLLAPSHNTNSGSDYAARFARFATAGGAVAQMIGLCAGVYAAYAGQNNGKIYAFDGYTPFTGCHTGVCDDTNLPEPGDILVDIAVLTKESLSATLLKQARSSIPKQTTVIGVYAGVEELEKTLDPEQNILQVTTPSTHDIVTNTVDVIKSTGSPESYELANEVFININSLGEGQINVCGENGNIHMGDLITTSSIPGKGMKQDDDLIRSYTVAKARETVTFSSPTEVKMIACTYHCG